MIPLSIPNLSGNEWKYIKECLDTNWVSSVGSYVTQFENKVAEFCGVRHAVATCNGTAALHISLMLAGVGQGDLVIVPDITFVAPLNAVKYTGADPLIVDVNEGDWQMDLDVLEDFLKKETRSDKQGCIHTATGRRIGAILPVHVLGNIGEIERLLRLAAAYGLPVVEDATEALGSWYRSGHAGSFGLLGCLSFNGNKILTTGGGGMILTNDEALAKKAKHLTTQAKSDPEEYFHDEVGYNYRLVNILAAMGVAQMEQLPAFLKRKKEVRQRYAELKEIPGICTQVVSKEVDANWWLYTVRCPRQKELRQFLKAQKIEVRPLWAPMHSLPAFSDGVFVRGKGNSDKLYSECLSLPCSSGITDEELSEVIGAIKKFYR